MSRDDKKRKKERKARNAEARARPLVFGEPRVGRWRDGIRFGKHPDAVWNPQWSGVKVPVDLADPNHMDGVVELTALALNQDNHEPS